MEPNPASLTGNSKPKLLDRVREVLRVKHYSIRTEDAYVDWIRRFILHHGKMHPKDIGRGGNTPDLYQDKPAPKRTRLNEVRRQRNHYGR